MHSQKTLIVLRLKNWMYVEASNPFTYTYRYWYDFPNDYRIAMQKFSMDIKFVDLAVSLSTKF